MRDPAPPGPAEPAALAAPRHAVQLPTRLWKVMLACGAAVWLVSAAVTELTDDEILVPTVIVVGSFLVPSAMAAFARSRPREGRLTIAAVLLGFLAAGTLAVMGTAVLEMASSCCTPSRTRPTAGRSCWPTGLSGAGWHVTWPNAQTWFGARGDAAVAAAAECPA